MTSIKPPFSTQLEMENNMAKDWGNDSLLDLENDLDGLEEMGELGESGEILTDDLSDPDLELDEWEEYMDSQWVKLID